MNDEIWNKIRNRERLTDEELDEACEWAIENFGLKKAP